MVAQNPEIIKEYLYLIPLFDETTEKILFCPKRDHNFQIGQMGKGRETLLQSMCGSTVKNLTLAFGSKIFS